MDIDTRVRVIRIATFRKLTEGIIFLLVIGNIIHTY